MTEKKPVSKKGFSMDWLLRGSLTKIGDTVDRFTGRRWIPSSSIATSELIERIKKLLDAEAKKIPGKGMVVPHNIKLKMQWDKFSTDSEGAIAKLERELLIATADHINDSLYYTHAPISLEVKPDYFTEGVKLLVSFDKFTDDDRDVEMNVTLPAINVANILSALSSKPAIAYETYIARFEVKSIHKEVRLEFPPDRSLSVGRTGSNALMIDDDSVSKIHAALSVDDEGRLSVADTGSTNGTFLSDQRISYGKATRLEVDERVKFGTVEVAFEFVPRPVVIEADDGDDVEDVEHHDTVSIDGFEFKRRVSHEVPDQTSPAIPIPEKTLPIEPPDETIRMDPKGNQNKISEVRELDTVVVTAVEDSDDEMKTETKVDQ